MIPSLAYTRAGEAVTSLEPHKGLLRGKVESGAVLEENVRDATLAWAQAEVSAARSSVASANERLAVAEARLRKMEQTILERQSQP